MTQFVLDDDQVRSVREATGRVAVRDRNGNLVAYFAKQPMATPEEIAIAKERMQSTGPWHTTEQVIERLMSLDPR
jgi:hypothetical protein